MKVEVTVRASAKQNSLTVTDDGSIRVHTTTTPQKGKANKEVRGMLAKHFKVARSEVILVRGAVSSRKVFEVPSS